ncbi:MAG: hypothetical protein EPN26_01525 [Rhodospirillales bacterium]|nr:MAG: hypothetical protein EPN26_01525 [Rhodospirillales bacterium]
MRRQFIRLFERLVYGDSDEPCRQRIESLLRSLGLSILTLHMLIVWQQVSDLHISYLFSIFVDSPLKYAARTAAAVLFVFAGAWWEIVIKLFLLVTGYLPSLVILAGPLVLVLARLVDLRNWRMWLDLVLAANWLFFGMNVMAMRWE